MDNFRYTLMINLTNKTQNLSPGTDEDCSWSLAMSKGGSRENVESQVHG